jgi:hypothetical protein
VSFHERVADLRSRVATLADERREFNEAQALQRRFNELEGAVTPLVGAAKRCALYREQGLRPRAIAKLADRLAKRVTVLRDRFVADPNASTLTKGVQWSQMLDDAKEGVGLAEASLAEAWRQYLDTLFGGDRPAELDSKLAPTEGNQTALARYRVVHSRLLQLRNNTPDAPEHFAEAKKVVEELKSIYQTFDFDVSLAVKMFLQAIGQGGASLDLLTDEVREWLHNNNSYNRYHIVVRNAST